MQRSGDTIQIKILSNYNTSEFSKLPTLEILGSNVEITWENNIGAANYTILGTEPNLNDKSKITFRIYNYSADSRSGEEITSVTFGKGVYFEK